jgi:hypothetical protein
MSSSQSNEEEHPCARHSNPRYHRLDSLRPSIVRLSAIEVSWVMLVEQINVGDVTANKIPRVTELIGY